MFFFLMSFKYLMVMQEVIWHIGGSIGLFYARQLGVGRDIGSGFQNIWQSIFTKKHLKTVYRAPQSKSATSKKSGESVHQNKIDSILDKISKSGYDSLSKEEKDYLFRAGKE